MLVSYSKKVLKELPSGDNEQIALDRRRQNLSTRGSAHLSASTVLFSSLSITQKPHPTRTPFVNDIALATAASMHISVLSAAEMRLL